MNVDLEIAKLTEESVERLLFCKSKEEFASIVERFHELKTNYYEENAFDTRKKSKTFWGWYGSEEKSYSWLLRHYLYVNPDCDLELLPDICKGNDTEIMFSIAITHPTRLDWLSSKNIYGTRNGHAAYVRNAVKKIDINSSAIEKIYLGDSLFFINKCEQVLGESIIRIVTSKFCFSFEEFVDELDGDLSGADLGDYIISDEDINKNNIVFDLSDKSKETNYEDLLSDISIAKINESICAPSYEKMELIPSKGTGIDVKDKNDLCEFGTSNIAFYYISDIHLCHHLQKKNISTTKGIETEVRSVVKKIKASLSKYENDIMGHSLRHRIIFAGDISSDKNIFRLFLAELHRQEITDAIFILGNHEYWDFDSVEEAVSWYKNIAIQYGYYCLHNEIFLLIDDRWKISEKIINGNDILDKSSEEIIELTEKARYVILGGTGFAGCNNRYNAHTGIYRNSLGENPVKARECEIEESNVFEKIYLKLLDVLNDRQVIVCTHNPIEDWTIGDYWYNWIYVNGHTHINNRIVSTERRVYADNQIGYNRAVTSLKYFSVDTRNNIYASYKDGIYEIKTIDYEAFMAGRNINLSMDNRINTLWMLKKSNYYMFMTQTQTQKRGLSVCILDGSRKKKVETYDLSYYLDNMMRVIERIEGVTVKYAEIIHRVADFVKSFGGSGVSHGCIAICF